MPGYSGRPLHKKLGFREGHTLFLHHPPDDYSQLLGENPPIFTLTADLVRADIIHAFFDRADSFKSFLETCRAGMEQDAAVWVSWPKKASKVPTDLSEDVIRNHALAIGMVDIKVCAVSSVWSGLKVVIRKENRT